MKEIQSLSEILYKNSTMPYYPMEVCGSNVQTAYGLAKVYRRLGHNAEVVKFKDKYLKGGYRYIVMASTGFYKWV